MSVPFDINQYKRQNQSSPNETQQAQPSKKFDINQYKRKPERSTGEKLARGATQYGIGAIEAATMPYNVAAMASNAYVQSPGVAETLYRKNIFKDIEDMAFQKQTGVWSPEDEAHFQSLQELAKNPEKIREKSKVNVQGLDTGSLIEKAFELGGVDIKPENMGEHAARWAGFIKDPKKASQLFQVTGEALSNPQKAINYAKAIFPTVKEATRGLGAAAALEFAADEQFGPMGTMGALIIGDLVGGGVPGAVKGAANFAKAPIQSTKKTLAKGATQLTKMSGAEKLAIQQDLIKEFREAGIQADLGSLTNSNLIKMMQARLVQSGLTGQALSDFRKNMTNQIVGEYGQLADKLGEARFSTLHEAGTALKEGVEAFREKDLSSIRELYNEARTAAKGKNVVSEIPGLAKKIDELEQQLLPGAVKSPETKKVLAELQSLKSEFFDAEGMLKPVPVQNLLNNKINLNDIINYEVQGGSKQLLKGIVKDIDDALIKYGNSNPEFQKAYTSANNRFSKHSKTYRNKAIDSVLKSQDPSSLLNKMNTTEGIRKIKSALGQSKEGKKLFDDLKRKKLDEIMFTNMVDGTTNQLKFGTFSNILSKGKNREIVKELLGNQAFQRLDRLTRSSGKLAESAQKFFNASQSGVSVIDFALVSKTLADIASLFLGNPWPLLKTAGGYATVKGLTKLITDPEFLKLVEEGVLASQKGNSKQMLKSFNALAPFIAKAGVYQEQNLKESNP